MKTHLSYLMGAEKITDTELQELGVKIVDKTKSGSRTLRIPDAAYSSYVELVKEKLSLGYWNEIVSPDQIFFIFKFADGHIEEYTLSPNNETQIDMLCAEFNNESPDKTANVYKYISENEFYHDLMVKHYSDMINR